MMAIHSRAENVCLSVDEPIKPGREQRTFQPEAPEAARSPLLFQRRAEIGAASTC